MAHVKHQKHLPCLHCDRCAQAKQIGGMFACARAKSHNQIAQLHTRLTRTPTHTWDVSETMRDSLFCVMMQEQRETGRRGGRGPGITAEHSGGTLFWGEMSPPANSCCSTEGNQHTPAPAPTRLKNSSAQRLHLQLQKHALHANCSQLECGMSLKQHNTKAVMVCVNEKNQLDGGFSCTVQGPC